MATPDTWRKSSYSGGGEGNACVEIANRHARIAVRDSKDPSQGTLSFPTGTFIAFVDVLKTNTPRKTA
ncbi:DUF397 domain-containing protein [Streptomyces sediminimaris]|uniref:DUF397 domain-containing protein n=1 Tax=Streptomyces sediminimaris TaxID=3383721 RepID=UPI0039997708